MKMSSQVSQNPVVTLGNVKWPHLSVERIKTPDKDENFKKLRQWNTVSTSKSNRGYSWKLNSKVTKSAAKFVFSPNMNIHTFLVWTICLVFQRAGKVSIVKWLKSFYIVTTFLSESTSLPGVRSSDGVYFVAQFKLNIFVTKLHIYIPWL